MSYDEWKTRSPDDGHYDGAMEEQPMESEAKKRRNGIRTSTDGQPFYCTYCGSGWNEYGACEDVRCELESAEEAKKRFVHVDPPPPEIGEYSDIMDEPL